MHRDCIKSEGKVLRRMFRLRTIKRAYWGATKFVPSTKYYYDDQRKEVEMGGTCSTNGRDEKWTRTCILKTGRKEIS
jgi:hypothetical protein